MSASDILNRVAQRFNRLVPEGSSVLAAVSGGGDSTALLFILAGLKERCAIGRMGVLHVNHGLRGSESDDDEKFVASLAQKLGVPLYVKKLSGKSLRAAGVEAWARSERYRFFLEVRALEQYDYIATGHTADDQAETVLLRIMRGTGLRGLRGILEKRGDGVVRPLIDLTRDEIISWLKSQNIQFRHDSSNDNHTFRRNRIRHELLPLLELQERGAFKKLLHIAEEAAEVWNAMRPAVDHWIAVHVQERGNCFFVEKKGLINNLFASEGLRTLFENHDIPADSVHIDTAIETARTKRAGGEYLLPGGLWRFYPQRTAVVFRKDPSPGNSTFHYALTVPGVTECPECGVSFIAAEESMPARKIKGDNRTVILDRDACGNNLVFRNWRRDDSFVPFGSDRVTDIGSFLSKQKIVKADRARMGVVEGRNGRIVWIPGVRISNHVRVTPETMKLLNIFYQSCPAKT